MVLGLRSRHRRDKNSAQVEYIVHVHEIKPWPSSQSLGSTESVLLLWEIADQTSGSLTSNVGEGKIEFNESFSLSLTLSRDKKGKDKFQKNFLEFHLKESGARGQLLGTSIVNVADYGVLEEALDVSTPLNCRKSSKTTAQPVLFMKIQPFDKNSSSNLLSRGSLSKQASIEKDGQASTMEEESDGDLAIASFTDEDDVSSQSSRTVASSAFEKDLLPQREKDWPEELPVERTEKASGEPTLSFGLEPAMTVNPTSVHDGIYSSNLPKRSLTTIRKEPVNSLLRSSSSSEGYRDIQKTPMTSLEHENTRHEYHEEIVGIRAKIKEGDQGLAKDNSVVRTSDEFESLGSNVLSSTSSYIGSSRIRDDHDSEATAEVKNSQSEGITVCDLEIPSEGGNRLVDLQEIGQEGQTLEEKRQYSEDNLVGKFLANRKQEKLRSYTLVSSRKSSAVQSSDTTNGKLKHVKSVQLPKTTTNASVNSQIKDNDKKTGKLTQENPKNPGLMNGLSERKDESKSRIELLEEELREAAAIEVGLYSVVAEHGGSMNKVHAPARRLSRFYLHAYKEQSKEKMASAARAAISGLALVSKACGNDVPRLTFWLSNSIMLRAIISQHFGDALLLHEEKKHRPTEEFDGWEEPVTFVIALEKVEAWIFSRIVESVWWQTLTPHMQSVKINGNRVVPSPRKSAGSKHFFSDQEQGRFSVDLWKKAFKDACERLCPIRAGGHECGCLSVLARLVMEQLVGRLDIAMFNAILRESDEEMPTDPVSDPITNPKVLPVPAGRSSFGAGVQLKNAIGSWSRGLTDLFGIEDNDSPDHPDVDLGDDGGVEPDKSFKPFRLLNALSDLMMLPFEMLSDTVARKEVCPTLSAPLIKRVVSNFIPDEFCPKPVPNSVLEALDSEDNTEASLMNFPCTATPTVYSPPHAASLSGFMGEIGSHSLARSGSSVLKKSYTSDDELEELDSPLTSIITGNFLISSTLSRPNWMPKGGRSVLRYQLLREIW